jgi:drug/metabolite transporter (DMT)-like permease
MYPVVYFIPIAGISLILSIVTLFIEREKPLRWIPLVFVLAGILLYALDPLVGLLNKLTNR